jgi:hypothetical protein
MLATVAFVLGITATAVAQQQDSLPPHLRDRGRGVRTSEFQTFIQRHQLLLLPSFAYIKDHNLEYNPLDWGYGNQTDLRGTFRNSSAQLLVAYGVTEWLAVEVEGSYLSARFERSARDTTATPARIRQSGLGDFAGQVRVRFAQERGRRPEIWGSVEVIPANQKRKVLIGDKLTDVKGEIGLTRGFRFGTMTLRTTVERNPGDHHWDLGETSLEYLRRLSPAWRILLAIEGGETGAPDEWVFVTAGQWRIANGCYLKLANGFGLMSKSTDWEPQVGILWEIH